MPCIRVPVEPVRVFEEPRGGTSGRRARDGESTRPVAKERAFDAAVLLRVSNSLARRQCSGCAWGKMVNAGATERVRQIATLSANEGRRL